MNPMQSKVREMAKEHLRKALVGKLRAKRISALAPQAKSKEPDEDDLGHYDVLQKLYDEDKTGK
jgi:3-methyladenine DNA glycosylase/8-oxoguanine DNA glycosylase